MTFAKKPIRPKSSNDNARKTKSNSGRSTKSKMLQEKVVESTRDTERKQQDQAKAAELFADWFLIDLGIRG
jgi:hypothetical protein